MGIGQTEQTKIWVLARQNRPKFGYWPDRADRNLGVGQTEQTEIWVLSWPNRPKYGYWPDRTDRNLDIGQTEQAETLVLARPNEPKYGYWPDRTDRNMGIGQTEQTKIAIGQTEGATHIFSRPLWTVAPDPLSATQVGLANTCLGSRTSSWDALDLEHKKIEQIRFNVLISRDFQGACLFYGWNLRFHERKEIFCINLETEDEILISFFYVLEGILRVNLKNDNQFFKRFK